MYLSGASPSLHGEPDHAFDKVLVVEKKTERPKFAHDKVAERHDMALVYSAGYATEALHELLDTARGPVTTRSSPGTTPIPTATTSSVTSGRRRRTCPWPSR